MALVSERIFDGGGGLDDDARDRTRAKARVRHPAGVGPNVCLVINDQQRINLVDVLIREQH